MVHRTLFTSGTRNSGWVFNILSTSTSRFKHKDTLAACEFGDDYANELCAIKGSIPMHTLCQPGVKGDMFQQVWAGCLYARNSKRCKDHKEGFHTLLQKIHSQGMVHGNLQRDHLLMNEDGHWKGRVRGKQGLQGQARS
ncbi:hypothetical protein CPC08DRAFT_319670 [Agrocybe pediades]|nr:hypothetical protein CPC08DRAFT_319670 [Agrocybe pediades]